MIVILVLNSCLSILYHVSLIKLLSRSPDLSLGSGYVASGKPSDLSDAISIKFGIQFPINRVIGGVT